MTITTVGDWNVGEKLRKFITDGSPNNWFCSGKIVFVDGDDEVVLVKRWLPRKRRHIWTVHSFSELTDYLERGWIKRSKRRGVK